MNKEERKPQWGFVSPDGHFREISSMTVESLEYAGKSTAELQSLLQENVETEQYEKCAVIRDELNKRSKQASFLLTK